MGRWVRCNQARPRRTSCVMVSGWAKDQSQPQNQVVELSLLSLKVTFLGPFPVFFNGYLQGPRHYFRNCTNIDSLTSSGTGNPFASVVQMETDAQTG